MEKVLKSGFDDAMKARRVKNDKRSKGKGDSSDDEQSEPASGTPFTVDLKQDEKKDIDFKAKAQRAKANALKMAAKRGQVSYNNKAFTDTNKQEGEKFKGLVQHLKLLEKQDLLPCVVFSFSRVGCEKIAK